jgi:hypothetical protein
MLRVASFHCPREVAPNAVFPVSLDVEYAIQGLPNSATIRGAIYSGNPNSSNPVWQSPPASVSNGGDEVWNFSLTAPSSEGYLNLTAYAFFLDNGTWRFFDNPVNGPGISQTTIKIGKTANLNIGLGAPGVDVTIDGTTVKTSSTGDAAMAVAVGSSPLIGVPPIVEFKNSTRIIFTAWSDGVTQPQRSVMIDGDVALIAYYKTQYLLRVNSVPTLEQWYDKRSNVTLTPPPSATTSWPLNMFGVTQSFKGWSGDVQSSTPQLNITMDSPKTISANFSVDYTPLAIPIIFSIGIAIAAISLIIMRRRSKGAPITEQLPTQLTDSTCANCGQATEAGWEHCIKCGAKLAHPDSAEK